MTPRMSGPSWSSLPWSLNLLAQRRRGSSGSRCGSPFSPAFSAPSRRSRRRTTMGKGIRGRDPERDDGGRAGDADWRGVRWRDGVSARAARRRYPAAPKRDGGAIGSARRGATIGGRCVQERESSRREPQEIPADFEGTSRCVASGLDISSRARGSAVTAPPRLPRERSAARYGDVLPIGQGAQRSSTPSGYVTHPRAQGSRRSRPSTQITRCVCDWLQVNTSIQSYSPQGSPSPGGGTHTSSKPAGRPMHEPPRVHCTRSRELSTQRTISDPLTHDRLSHPS